MFGENEASVAPSDGALYRPDCIASQIQDVSYVGGLKYLLLTTRGEVLVLDAFKAAQEQAYQNCDIAGCLGTRCHTILLSGVLDFRMGDRWICEVERETIKVTCADDESRTFRQQSLGHSVGAPKIPGDMQHVFPLKMCL